MYVFAPRRFFKEKQRVGNGRNKTVKTVYYRGQYDQGPRMIRVNLGQGSFQREVTLIHETIHAAIPTAPEMQVENAAVAAAKALRSARRRELID